MTNNVVKPDVENGLAENPDSSTIKWIPKVPYINFNMIKSVLIFVIMCGISAGIGYASYATQHASQLTVLQHTADSSALQLQFTVQAALSQKFAASRLVGKLFGHATKLGYGTMYGQELPAFTLPGYQDLSTEILTLAGNLRGMAWYPLVDTTNNTTRLAWEAWAKKNTLAQTKEYGLAGNVSIFNKMNATAYKYGIWNLTSHGPVRAGDVIPGGDPRYQHWLFPLWQASPLTGPGVPGAVLIEEHGFVGTRMQTIEHVMSSGYGSNGAFTDVVQLSIDPLYRPATLFFTPVYSISPNPSVIGLTGMNFEWDTLFLNALPDNLPRFDCVLSTKTTTATFAVDHGTVTIVGKGDFHESAMTVYGKQVVFDAISSTTLSASGYTITVYPSSAFYKQYITQFPVNLGIGVGVAIFVVLCMLYTVVLLYGQIQKDRLKSLRDLLESKKQHVRYMSHELRTPLNAATLGLNMVVTQMKKNEHPTPADEELCETLSDIRLACSTAVDILNDLLSFEKLESGILVLHRENISALNFVKEGIVMFSAQAKEKEVTLDLISTIDETTLERYPNAMPLRAHDVFSCDRFKMDQVFRNLVSNAIKFSPEGGTIAIRSFFQKNDSAKNNLLQDQTNEPARNRIQILSNFLPASLSLGQNRPNDSVEVVPDVNQSRPPSDHGSADINRGNLIIIITDNGPGISEENQKKLFRSVIQFDPEKNQGGGGSGFGLFISKGLNDDKGDVVVRPAHTPIMQHQGHPSMGQREVLSSRDVKSVTGHGGVDHSKDQRSSTKNIQRGEAPSRGSRFGSVGNLASLRVMNHNHRVEDASSTPVVVLPNDALVRLKYYVLVVDDSGLNRKLLCKALRAAGHSCEEAADGLLALNKVKQKLAVAASIIDGRKSGKGHTHSMYDAILMDSNMPTMDGPSSVSAMRALGVTIPIFGVTGNGEEKDIQHFKSNGATEVFVKPLNVADFLSKMKLLHLM